jgi:hypothetical protein
MAEADNYGEAVRSAMGCSAALREQGGGSRIGFFKRAGFRVSGRGPATVDDEQRAGGHTVVRQGTYLLDDSTQFRWPLKF